MRCAVSVTIDAGELHGVAPWAACCAKSRALAGHVRLRPECDEDCNAVKVHVDQDAYSLLARLRRHGAAGGLRIVRPRLAPIRDVQRDVGAAEPNHRAPRAPYKR